MCNQLLREGVHLINSKQDVMRYLSLFLVMVVIMTSAVNMSVFLANSNENTLGENYSLPNDSSFGGNSPLKGDPIGNLPVSTNDDDNVKNWKTVLKMAGLAYSEYDNDLTQVFVEEDSVEIVIGFSKFYGYNEKIFAESLERGCEVTHYIQQLNAISIKLPIAKLDSVMSTYENLDYVRYIEPNQCITIDGVPNDPDWSLQWGPQRIDVPNAWALETGDFAEVLVAIIDSGIEYTHPDLSAQYVALGYDWYNNDSDPMDDYGHGTHCAGIVAATINNSVGIAGVANVKIMAEKFLSSGGSGNAIGAALSITHAVDAGADILSNSWGGGAPDILIEDALKYAAANDVVIIASAGNSGSDMANYPAYYPEAISVSATDVSDNLAGFSTYGSTIEIAAPGVDIYSTVPVSQGSYAYKSGTSMACPHVSGVAALIKSAFPTWSAERIRERLQEATEDLGDPGRDIYFGYGLINAWYAVMPPQPHDLKVNVEAPTIQNVNSTVLVNATVSNHGLNNETNVMLELYINKSLVDSQLFAKLNVSEKGYLYYDWSPTQYGTYNITAYAQPVSGETWLINNNATRFSNVVPPEKRIVFLYNHGERSYLSELGNYYTSIGYFVDVITSGLITNSLLAKYKFAFTSEGGLTWLPSEISAIQNFMALGGVFAGIGDSSPADGTTQLASTYGITFTGSGGGLSGPSTNINTFHPIMFGVTSVFIPSPFNAITVSAPAEWILKESTNTYIYGTAVNVGAGHFIVLADDFGMNPLDEDNEVMFQNLLNWQEYDHEVMTNLEVERPHINETSSIKATVLNGGLENETNVDVEIYINGTLVANKTIATLASKSFDILEYEWTPTEFALYNITAFATIVFNDTNPANNRITKFVSVIDLQNYYMMDNAPFNWIDTSGGTLIPLSDDSSATISLPFNFTFYDQTFDSIHVSSNGWLSFVTPGNYHLAGPTFPTSEPLFNYAMALYWTDLYPSSNVYYVTLTDPDRFVVIYDNINYFGGSGAGSFEIILYETGEIAFQYADLTNTYAPSSVGLNYGLDIGYYNYVDTTTEPFIGTTDQHAILFTTYQFEHELIATLDVSKTMFVDETQIIDASVLNIGLNDETDIEVKLWIDNLLVSSETYPIIYAGSYETLQYSYTPTSSGLINITFEILPKLNETYTENNKISKFINVYSEGMGVVAILNSLDRPDYATGGFNNDYLTLQNGLLSYGYSPVVLTNADIISGSLSGINMLILIDNLPSNDASPIIGEWCNNGGNILSFDSSICLLNYEGILPPEANGTNGKDVYWDYNSVSTGYIRNVLHPVMAGYTLNSTLPGVSGDARIFNDEIALSSAGPYFTSLVEPETDGTYSFVSAYDSLYYGKVVQIWINNHWSNAEFHLMILNTLEWFDSTLSELTLTLNNPKSGQTIAGSTNIKWDITQTADLSVTSTVDYWNGTTWINLATDITDDNYRWNTMSLDKGSYYKIRVTATDGLSIKEVIADGLTIRNNLIFAYIVPIAVVVTGLGVGAGFYIARVMKRKANLG